MNQVYCVLDYETRSEAPITECGAWEYANHPTTQILCISWRIGTEDELKTGKTKTQVWSPAIPSPYGELKKALLNPDIILVAHNAFFEQVITRFVLTKIIKDETLKNIPLSRWMCTASMARALALPGKLEKACLALKLKAQKDMQGHRLMLKMSKPRKPTKGNPNRWHEKLSDLKRLMDYCKGDTDAEVELFCTIPKLSPNEREVWLLDQKINHRGFRCDRPLIKKCLTLIAEEQARLLKLTHKVTQGQIRSPGQIAKSLEWLKSQGVTLPNLQAQTVEEILATPRATGLARTFLKIRQAISKTSTSKYEAFESRTRFDGRARDTLVYSVASTGRFGGAGIQPHNFPARGILKGMDQAAEIILDQKTDLELIRLIYGSPMNVFSSLLRSVIQASEGCELFGGDFAGIEVRMLFWLARHEHGLDAFRQGRDLYIEQATGIFNRNISKEDEFERQLGKKVVLGAGFQLGKDGFYKSCLKDGIKITKELAADAVSAYREIHKPVTLLWSNLEKAAIAAVKNPGKKYTINRTSWWVSANFLYCTLPSGRRLAYYGPEIRNKLMPWGETKESLFHWDINPLNKQWFFNSSYGGKLAENITQAAARDLMVDAMLRVEKAGYPILITVHDEILSEKEKGKGSVSEFEKLMAQVPKWAEGLPVKVEAWTGSRYKK